MKLNNKQKKIILYSGLGIVLIVIVLIFVLFNNKEEKLSNKDKVQKYLEDKVSNYFEESYYDQMDSLTGDIKSFLSNFKKEGITVSVEVMIQQRIISETEAEKELVNKDTKEKCDYNQTRVIIYPEEPYKKDSYKLETKLYCGFED